MDGVHPKVHEFLPQNTHLCTKRAGLCMVCTPRRVAFHSETPICAPNGMCMDCMHPRVHVFLPQNTHLRTNSVT